MHVIPGNSQSIIVTNIKALQDAGYPPEQAQAIAFHSAGNPRFQGKSHKKAGMVKSKLPKKNAMRTTPLKGNTGFGFSE